MRGPRNSRPARLSDSRPSQGSGEPRVDNAMEPPQPPARELASFLGRLTLARRRALGRLCACLVALAVAGALFSWHKERVRAYVRGEIDLDGAPRYEPAHPVDRRALARIDLARVHGELIPAWTIATGRATSPGRRALAERAYEELAAEVAPDANLAELLASTHRALRDDPLENARRLDYLLWAYNRYLDEQELPWRLEASLSVGEARAIFRTMTYEVLADARTREGHRLRLLRRADRTNTLEGWLGHSQGGDEGALVLLARVLHFTIRHVWPGLHPALDPRRPEAERPWLGYVRGEVRAALDAETYRLLSETAVDQQTLIEVAASIEARRACGSRYRIRELPYNGLSPRGLRSVRLALERSAIEGGEECPEITLDEAARIVGASERLASTDGLAEAVERLTMVVARSVSVHELQHVADGDEIACPGCPKWLEQGVARAEVSAYLSALSTEGVGYLALLQACATPRGEGLHGAALRAVLEAILPYGCEGPTRHDLYGYAERIEARLFGKRGDVTLPAELPERVALLARPAGRPPSRPVHRPLESGWGVALSARVDDQRERAQRSHATPVP